MQEELNLKFIRTDSQGESIEWLFDILDKFNN